MPNYDFLVFSPFEFENFCRDLLQKKLGVFIESFTSGRDTGIDLRYTSADNKKVIIQVKRYEKYSQLLSNLKAEKKTVDELKPERYILCTNVGLTPPRKAAIQKIFGGYIKTTEDIFGRTDLNNLLGLYKEIEQDHYKLWLASTNVLHKILHSKIYNQSTFKLEEIRESIKLYVPNSSFNEALQILKEHKYVIISGIPGIGKSTLAYMLVSYLLSRDYDEFVYMSQSIDEGYSFYVEGKKQVFLFDDFLGKNYFTAEHEQNTDEKIVTFIKKIQRSTNKIFILATREYILRQARNSFEAFNVYNIELAKCVLDISTYTNIIKAKILYQHLFFSDIPSEYLQDLLRDGNYLKLVRHKNYNPRIIETVLNERIWKDSKPSAFSEQFIGYFQNPQTVWLRSFEKSLDDFQRYCLLVLATMGTPVLMDNLSQALKNLLLTNHHQLNLSYETIRFNLAIRTLENTYISTSKDHTSNIAIEYQNPSVQDFLVNYLRDKHEIIQLLIDSAIFYEQFFTIFKTDTIADVYSAASKILLNQNEINRAATRILHLQMNVYSCRFTRELDRKFNTIYVNRKNFKYQFLKDVFDGYAFLNEEAKKFVYKNFQEGILIATQDRDEQDAFLSLIEYLDKDKLEYDEEQVFDNFFSNVKNVDALERLPRFQYIFPDLYVDILDDYDFKNRVYGIVQDEIESSPGWDLDNLKTQVESIQSNLDIDFKKFVREIDEKIEEHEAEYQLKKEASIQDVGKAPEVKKEDEVQVIAGLFESLVQQKK